MKKVFLLLLAMVLMTGSCLAASGNASGNERTTSVQDGPAVKDVHKDVHKGDKKMVNRIAVFETNLGNFSVELFEDETPITTENFIDLADPEYVLILSGDHIYTMDYSWMLDAHKANKAEATIGVIEVPWEEAPRFGIMNTDKTGRIEAFEEKPAKPKSNLASMGIYIFNKDFLKKYLEEDAKDETSSHDFGKNIIPKMLADKARLYSYAFDGYWKDVGTIESLWQANMDLLQDQPPFELNGDWKIYSSNPSMPPHYVGPDAKVKCSMISEGSMVLGDVENSVIFPGVRIGKGAKVRNSVIMPSTVVRENAVVDYAIVAQNCEISEGAKVAGEKGAITVIADGETVVAAAAGSKQAG